MKTATMDNEIAKCLESYSVASIKETILTADRFKFMLNKRISGTSMQEYSQIYSLSGNYMYSFSGSKPVPLRYKAPLSKLFKDDLYAQLFLLYDITVLECEKAKAHYIQESLKPSEHEIPLPISHNEKLFIFRGSNTKLKQRDFLQFVGLSVRYFSSYANDRWLMPGLINQMYGYFNMHGEDLNAIRQIYRNISQQNDMDNLANYFEFVKAATVRDYA